MKRKPHREIRGTQPGAQGDLEGLCGAPGLPPAQRVHLPPDSPAPPGWGRHEGFSLKWVPLASSAGVCRRWSEVTTEAQMCVCVCV